MKPGPKSQLANMFPTRFELKPLLLGVVDPCGCMVRWKDRNRGDTAQQAIHLKGNLRKCCRFAVHICHMSFASTFVDVVRGVSEESAVRLCENK